jgi:hypothetical protein
MYVLRLAVLAHTAEIDRVPHSGLESTVPPKLDFGTNTPGFAASITNGHPQDICIITRSPVIM